MHVNGPVAAEGESGPSPSAYAIADLTVGHSRVQGLRARDHTALLGSDRLEFRFWMHVPIVPAGSDTLGAADLWATMFNDVQQNPGFAMGTVSV